jgi:hypothetical protein
MTTYIQTVRGLRWVRGVHNYSDSARAKVGKKVISIVHVLRWVRSDHSYSNSARVKMGEKRPQLFLNSAQVKPAEK